MRPESETRRPEWVEGSPIKLADGQVYHFRRPVVEFRLSFDGGKPKFGETKLGTGTADSFGPEFWELLDEFHRAEEADDRLNAYAAMSVWLLRLNYHLDDDAIVELLPFVASDEDNQAMWSAIIDVASGAGKKAMPGGLD